MRDVSIEKKLKRLKAWKSKIQQRIDFYWYDDDEQLYQQICKMLKERKE